MDPIRLRRRLSTRLLVTALVTTTALAWHVGSGAQTAAATVATQTSSEHGVTVKVTPKATAIGASQWEFAVVLDTHSQDLGDDLLKAAVLVADGREIRPFQWAGAAPGGHHREGALLFAAPDQPVSSIELRLQRPNETTPRVLRWDAAALR